MILLGSKRIERTLRRMSYQIVEEARGAGICLVGLNERGYHLAKQIQPVVEKATGGEVSLDRLHADDDSTFTFSGEIEKSPILVLVDDVIFSGETMHRAIQKIPELSAFENIYIVVLVDRGHRKIPVQASITGIHIPTKLNEQVELRFEKGFPKEVILTEK